MSDAVHSAPGHRGVAEDDPRNAGPIAYFAPQPVTRVSALARLAPYYVNRDPRDLEAAIGKLMQRVETGPIRPEPPLSQPVEAAPEPWTGLDVHPDLVEEMWACDDALPSRCRWLLWGRAALVHPATGVVFAVGVGSVGWIARLPNAVLAQADPKLAAVSAPRRPAAPLDIDDVGPNWRFLCAGAPKLDWIRSAFDSAGEAAS